MVPNKQYMQPIPEPGEISRVDDFYEAYNYFLTTEDTHLPHSSFTNNNIQQRLQDNAEGGCRNSNPSYAWERAVINAWKRAVTHNAWKRAVKVNAWKRAVRYRIFKLHGISYDKTKATTTHLKQQNTAAVFLKLPKHQRVFSLKRVP